MDLHFTYTFADYREAAKLIRRPMAGDRRSARIESIVALVLGIGLMIAFLALSTSQDALRGGDVQSTYFSRFASGFFFWPLLIGVLWSVSIRRADPPVRRYTRLIYLVMAAGALIFCALVSLAPEAPTPPSPPQSLGASLLPLLPWVAVFVFTWIGVYLLLKVNAKIGWAGQRHLLQPYTARLADDTLEMENATQRTIYRWPAFLRFHETKDQFVLQSSKLAFVMIPKRACRDGEQVEALRRLLLERIPTADGQAIGFAVVVQPPPLPR